MKYIGLDLGSRTLGVAISDETGFLARAYDTFRFKDDNYEAAINYTIDVCQKENVSEVVLGLPKHMNGDLGERAQISIDFKERLEKMMDVQVILEDERLTTVIATNNLLFGDVSRKKRKQVVDKMAAVEILQGYLDRIRSK